MTKEDWYKEPTNINALRTLISDPVFQAALSVAKSELEPQGILVSTNPSVSTLELNALKQAERVGVNNLITILEKLSQPKPQPFKQLANSWGHITEEKSSQQPI